jgi:1-acyl-sn-glycerol-3-phosphate acyltransferase
MLLTRLGVPKLWREAKAELLATPIVGEPLQWTGAFPVRRGAHDGDALTSARQLVRQGHVVCFFVEGTRQRLGYPFSYPGRFHTAGIIVARQEQAY